MPRLPGRIRVLCVAAAAALLAAGCSGSGGSGAVGGLEKTTLKIAAVPAMDSAGLYIAQQRGFFAQEGLHVQILAATSSADVIQQQLAGKWDITAGAYPSYIAADENQKANLKVLVAGSTWRRTCRTSSCQPGRRSPRCPSCPARRFTSTRRTTSASCWSRRCCRLTRCPAKVNFVAQPFPAMGPMLAHHQIAAAWLPEPFISLYEEKYGVQPLADANQGAAENLPIEGYVATQSWLNKYPHTAEAFRIALEKAQAIASTNLDAVQQAMTAFAGVPSLAASVLPAPGFPTTTQAGPLQRVITLMVNFNMIKAYNAQNLIAKIPSG